PGPFTLVSTLLYLGILALFFYGRLVVESQNAGPNTASGPANLSHPVVAVPVTWHWNEVLAVCAVLVLLAVDRVEFRFFGDMPPAGGAVGLLGLRVVLIEVVAQLDQF